MRANKQEHNTKTTYSRIIVETIWWKAKVHTAHCCTHIQTAFTNNRVPNEKKRPHTWTERFKCQHIRNLFRTRRVTTQMQKGWHKNHINCNCMWVYVFWAAIPDQLHGNRHHMLFSIIVCVVVGWYSWSMVPHLCACWFPLNGRVHERQSVRVFRVNSSTRARLKQSNDTPTRAHNGQSKTDTVALVCGTWNYNMVYLYLLKHKHVQIHHAPNYDKNTRIPKPTSIYHMYYRMCTTHTSTHIRRTGTYVQYIFHLHAFSRSSKRIHLTSRGIIIRGVCLRVYLCVCMCIRCYVYVHEYIPHSITHIMCILYSRHENTFRTSVNCRCGRRRFRRCRSCATLVIYVLA